MILTLFQVKYIKMQTTACCDIDKTLEHRIHKNECFAFICGNFYRMTEETQVRFLIRVSLHRLWAQDSVAIPHFI